MACNVLLVLVILSAMKFNMAKSSDVVHNIDKTVADSISQKVKVMCGVVMSLDVDPTDRSITDTWGRRCNKLIIMNEPPSESSKSPLYWDKQHLRYMYLVNTNADWFLLSTTERNYIVVENLRYMLADHDPNDAIYFMLVVSDHEGVCCVLSRKSIDLFVNTDIQHNVCNTMKNDVVARENCFRAIGLKREDSQDFLQRDRIIAGDLYKRRAQQGPQKFWDCRNLPERPAECYSDFAISFDGVNSKIKYVLDYLIYQLRPYGIKFGGRKSHTKPSDVEDL